MATLNKKVNNAKKDISLSLGSSIASSVGILIFGIYTGLLANDTFRNIVGPLGFAKVFSDSAKTFTDYFDSNKVVRDDNLYFLWQVKELGNKRKRFQNILL